jgi:phospholipid transport system substrate-binding protein
MLRSLARLAPLFIAAFLFANGAFAGSDAPQAQTELLHQTLTQAMQRGQNTQARYQMLASTIPQIYDFEQMATVTAGSHWSSGDPAARRRYAEAFTRYSVMNYASQFKDAAGTSFETIGEREGPRGSILVDTKLIRGKEAIPLTYVFAERDGQWRINDVLVDNSISELARRRSEFAATLKSGGLDKLSETLDAKSAEMAQ